MVRDDAILATLYLLELYIGWVQKAGRVGAGACFMGETSGD